MSLTGEGGGGMGVGEGGVWWVRGGGVGGDLECDVPPDPVEPGNDHSVEIDTERSTRAMGEVEEELVHGVACQPPCNGASWLRTSRLVPVV